MAKKKEELAAQYHFYEASMKKAKRFIGQGLYAEAVKSALEGCEHVDSMMQYAHKYQEREFHNIEAIDLVVKYAPFLFDFESLNSLEELLKSCKRIEKNTSVCIGDRLAGARNLVAQAHILWNYLDREPDVRQDQLRKNLGGEQEEWRYIAEHWEKMGLIIRQKEGASYRLSLQTRMEAETKGKCPRCGSFQEAPRAMLLEETACPDCGATVCFVILS